MTPRPATRRCETKTTLAVVALTGLSLTEIAARCGMAPQDLGRIVHAHRTISPRVRELFLDAIRGDLDAVLFPAVGPS